MFRGYWLAAIALGLAGLGLLLLASKNEAQADTTKPSSEPYSYSADPNDLWPLPSADHLPATAVAEQEQPKPHYQEIDCGAPENYEQADLCEQRRMAKSAEDAVWWSRFQSWLGVFGFFAVVFSLVFTGWAALAAAEAAAAAKLSAEAMHRIERAYLFFDDDEITIPIRAASSDSPLK